MHVQKQLGPAYKQLDTTPLSSGAHHCLNLLVLTLALCPRAQIQGQRTKNTSIQDYNNPTTTHQDPSSEFFFKEKNLEKARGLQGTYPQRRLLNFFYKRPLASCPNKQEARGLHSLSALFSEESAYQSRRINQKETMSRFLFRRNQNGFATTQQDQEE
jgi:hypothetical protein